MSVKRFDISGEHYEVFGDNNGEYCLYEDYAALEQRLIESERYGRQTDITIDNLEMKLAQMAAENAGLKSAIDSTIGWQQSTDPENVESVRTLLNIKTPYTDAYKRERGE